MCPFITAWAQNYNEKFEKIADLLEFGFNKEEALRYIDDFRTENVNKPEIEQHIEKYVKEVKEPAADTLLMIRRNGARVFHSLSVSKLGEFDSTTIRLKLISLWLESLFEKDEKSITDYANYLKQHMSEVKGVEANKLTVTLDCMALEKKMSCRYGYSPEEYVGYLAQERNVMYAFPVPEDEKSWWKLRAYRSMGNSRAMITRPNQLFICSIGTEFDVYKNSELKKLNDFEYSDLNNSRGWFYKRVNDISNHLYNQILVSEDHDCGVWLYKGDPGFETWGKPEAKDYAKLIYGAESPNYIKFAYKGVLKSLLMDVGNRRVIDSFAKEIENCDGLTEAQKLIWKLELYKKVFNFMPDLSKMKFLDINSNICEGEDTSYEWDELAHRLYDVDVQIFKNYNDAFWKSLKRKRILKQLEGYNSPLSSSCNIEYLDRMLESDEKQFKESLKTYRELADYIEGPLKDYVFDEYKLLETYFYFYKKRDLVKVKKLAQDILSKKDVNPDVRNEIMVDLAIAESVMNGKNRYSDNLIRDAFTYCQKIPASMRNISSLMGAALYYNNISDFENARNVIDFAIETQREVTGEVLNDTYIELKSYLSSISLKQGHSNEKRRIMNEDVDRIASDPFYIPTISTLNYLWTAYDIVKNDNLNDAGYLSYFYSVINDITTKLAKTTSDIVDFQRTYLIRSMAEIYWLNVRFNEEQNKIDFANITDEMKECNKQQKSALESAMDQLTPVFSLCEELLEGTTLSVRDASIALGYYSNKANYIRFVLNDKEKAKKTLGHLNKLKFPESMKNQINSALSNYYIGLNDFVEAEKYYRRFLTEIGEDYNINFSNKHWHHYIYYNYYKQIGDNAKAVGEAREFYKVMKQELDTHYQLMTSSDQENFMNMYGDPARLICNELENNREELAKEVYDGVVYRTGMQLRSQQATQRELENTNDPKLIQMRDELNRMRLDYSKFETSYDDQSRLREASDLMRRIRLQEQKIFDMTASARKDVNKTVTWDMIRDNLAPESAAIEFTFSQNHIMALVLKPGCQKPEVVELAKQKEVEDYLKSVGAKNTSALAKGLYGVGKAELYSMLWKPLEQALSGIKDIYFTAPGMLNSISFNALCDETDVFVFDKYNLHQLTSTAELVNTQDKSKPHSATLAGDILFSPEQAYMIEDEDLESSREVNMDYSLNDFSERGASREYFPYLPFTAKELDAIKEILSGLNVTTISRQDATESRIRDLCSTKPDILHLATHGFFLSTEADASQVPYMRKFQKTIGNSMQRAGVALSGAEETWCGAENPEDNDGILTAVEVSDLNLKGTKLVVLSACDTALGNYSYEGIYGLPRGFKQAGVQSLLVSLWSVNDNSTAMFMTQFYKNWMNGMSKHEAFQSAIKSVRASFPNPYNWAPFILLD